MATLVARDAPSTEVFDAVATEVAKLLDTDITVLGRYDDDGAATAIGSWSASPVGVPVGTRSVVGGRNVLTIVAETGKPARVDGYDDATGEAAEIARRHGWRSSIAASPRSSPGPPPRSTSRAPKRGCCRATCGRPPLMA